MCPLLPVEKKESFLIVEADQIGKRIGREYPL